jgi:hypothetical protein
MKAKVSQMTSPRTGTPVANQFIIKTDKGVYFQSYDSIIVYRSNDGKLQLGKDWNYSRTTSKYRCIFLDESTETTKKKIKEGIYKINKNL